MARGQVNRTPSGHLEAAFATQPPYRERFSPKKPLFWRYLESRKISGTGGRRGRCATALPRAESFAEGEIPELGEVVGPWRSLVRATAFGPSQPRGKGLPSDRKPFTTA